MRNYAGVELTIVGVLLLALSLFSGCAVTQLHGTIYTADKEPAKNLKILVKAEPGNRSTYTRKDGSFILRGLEPNTAYSIIATCEADNTTVRVENIYIKKGKNLLPENKILILAIHKPAEPQEEPTEQINDDTGPTVPEKP